MLNVVNRKEEYIYSRASVSICSSPTFFSLKELDRYTQHHNLICIHANEHKLDQSWTLPEAQGLLALLLDLAPLLQFHPECGGKKRGNDSSIVVLFNTCPIEPLTAQRHQFQTASFRVLSIQMTRFLISKINSAHKSGLKV